VAPRTNFLASQHLARQSVNLQVVEFLGSATATTGSALYAALALKPLVLRMSTSI
jgi:hypothetical protein